MDKPSVWRQVHQQQASGGGGAGAAGNAVVAAGASAASPPCRPTGARWTPTPEQVKILKELYYGCGIRSPSAEQIQRIAARLRQFGRIEGKNVFYWFQNHKARERHKKRLAVDASSAGADHLGVVLSPSPGSGAAAASTGGFYGAYNGGHGGSAMQMDRSTTTTAWGDSTWMAASSGGLFGASTAAMDGSTTTTCWGDSAAGIGATDRSFVQLQDYMGVTRSTGAGNHGPATAQTRWPACFSLSADQAPPMMTTTTTREPETLPLFPTGGQGSYLQQQSSSNSNFQWWGAATTTTATTNTTAFQQQHHHQLQDQQYTFYSSSNQQLMMMPRQDAGTSLELTLSHPAGRM